MYLQAENEVSQLMLSNVTARTKQTDTQTDVTERITSWTHNNKVTLIGTA